MRNGDQSLGGQPGIVGSSEKYSRGVLTKGLSRGVRSGKILASGVSCLDTPLCVFGSGAGRGPGSGSGGEADGGIPTARVETWSPRGARRTRSHLDPGF